jgi:hypothetical protein
MLSKRSLLVLLVGANLLLAGLLIMEAYPMPRAEAAGPGQPGSFVCVTANAPGQSYDALFVFDDQTNSLHVLYPEGNRSMGWGGFRRLEEDFSSGK